MEFFSNNQKYQIIKKLGQGGFGSAFQVLNVLNNEVYVIKQISLKNAEEKETEAIKNEGKILSSLNNENIVKYVDSFTDNDNFNIVMEYCDGLDLRKFIKEYKESGDKIDKYLIYYFIIDICEGLKDVHKNNLIHRDLKPENLFLTEEEMIKIGDFGIAKQLNSINEYAKTQVGTILYMAPEILKGKQYNNKVDIWALGCIIHELCTLNFCFSGSSLNETINNVINIKHEKIDVNFYGSFLQDLIDSCLNLDYDKRPDIDYILTSMKKEMIKLVIEKIEILLEKDEVYQNYIFEKKIEKEIDLVDASILNRENKFSNIKYWLSGTFIGMPIYCLSIGLITGGVGVVVGLGLTFISALTTLYLINPRQKINFINDNLMIVTEIECQLIELIKTKLDKKLLNEIIFILNEENFNKQINKVKEKLISKKYIKRLQKVITKTFNILLLGNTNVGKSTLINEFLCLGEKERAEESEGGPTQTVDFTPYIGKRNNKEYTLYDTNGITNDGQDSIENKTKNTIKEIKQRIENKDPNKLIHCIWYCFQGSNIQPCDCDFIKKLLDVYSTYSIPIIFVHTQTYSIGQSNTCKKGVEKYLKKIYENDITKVEEHIKHYINILAKGEEGFASFGLNELEKMTKREIEVKGFKSAYFELIKKDIYPILINGLFSLVFTDNNLKQLREGAMKNLDKYLKSILDILSNDKLGLSEETKKNNKKALETIYTSFKNAKIDLKDELTNLLQMKNLIKNNAKLIKEIYEEKSDKYKKENSFDDFRKNVENLIYDNIHNNSDEIINNILNQGFNFFIVETMKQGIKEQFKKIEKEIIGEIYTKLFEEY